MVRSILLVASFFSTVAYSQSAFAQRKWLEAIVSVTDKQLEVFLWRGKPGSGQPMRQGRSGLTRFYLLSSEASKRLDLQPILREAGTPLVEVAQRDLPTGTNVVLLDTTSYLDNLTASQLQEYLTNEPPEIRLQLEGKVDQKAQQRGLVMVVRRTQRCMAIVQNGPTLTDPLPSDPLDDELKFVLLSPTNTLVKDSAPTFQVQYRRQPLINQGIWIWHWDNEHELTKHFMRTDEKGQIHPALNDAGKWLLSVTRMRWANEPVVDWSIQESTLRVTVR